MGYFNEEKWNEFRAAHPELRFWQAMREFLYVARVVVEYPDDGEVIREDTYNWQDDK